MFLGRRALVVVLPMRFVTSMRHRVPVALILVFFSLSTLCGACGDSNKRASSASGASLGLVVGRVRNEDGSPLAKVDVRAGERSVQTDDDGSFEIEVAAGDAQRVAVDSKEFAGGEVVLKLGKGASASVELSVIQVRTLKVDDAEAGGRFEDDDGFAIKLPKDGLRHSDGSVVKGQAEIRYATVRDPRAMRAPPELRGMRKGEAVRLSSKGIVDVRFYKGDSRLAFEGDAELEVPLPKNNQAADGDRITLFHYDEKQHRFEEEGEATVRDGKWKATVTKFSWWTAADVVEEVSCVAGDLRSPEDMPASYTLVTAVGLDDLWLSSSVVDDDGHFCVEVPAQANVALSAFFKDGDARASWTAETSGADAAGACGSSDCVDLGTQRFEASDTDAGNAPDMASDAGAMSDAANGNGGAFTRVMESKSSTPSDETVSFSFGASGSERLAYTLESSAGVVADIRLLGPDGKALNVGSSVVSGGATVYEDTFVLPAVAGAYVLEIKPRSPASGAFTLDLFEVPEDSQTALNVDGAEAELSVGSVGQNAIAIFNAAGGERLAYTLSSTSDGTADVQLVGPAGAALNVGSNVVSAGRSTFEDAFVLPSVAGEYRFLIDPRAQSTGNFRFRLFSVPDDALVDGSIGAGPTTIAVSSIAQNAVYRFTSVGSERLAYTLASSADTPADVTLVDPNGQALSGTGGSVVSAGSTTFEDSFNLPAVAGAYELRIDPRTQGTGEFVLNLFSVPADASPGAAYALSDYATAPNYMLTTSVPGQNVALDIVVSTPSESAAFLVENGTTTPVDAELRDPAGNRVSAVGLVVSANSSGFADPFLLPIAGTYHLTLNPRTQGTGNVSVRFFRVPPPVTATVQTSSVLTTTVPGQVARFQFALTAGQTFGYQVTRQSSGGGAVVADARLFDPADAVVQVGQGSVVASPLNVSGLSAASTGTYTLEVDPRGSGVDSYTLTLTLGP